MVLAIRLVKRDWTYWGFMIIQLYVNISTAQ